eukprot:215010-Rhodomonas_salina.1
MAHSKRAARPQEEGTAKLGMSEAERRVWSSERCHFQRQRLLKRARCFRNRTETRAEYATERVQRTRKCEEMPWMDGHVARERTRKQREANGSSEVWGVRVEGGPGA